MRILRVPLVVLGLVVALPLGCGLLYLAMQFNDVVQRAEASPVTMTAAQLIENGPPKNLHVEVTNFTFGEPVVEKNKDGWESVWLPIKPKPALKGAGKRSLFVRIDARDQAAVDGFVGQKKLTALVGSALPKECRWRVNTGPALRKAYPKLDPNQTIYLAEPTLSILGLSFELTDERLYDPWYHSAVAWSGAGLLFFVVVSLLLARFGSDVVRRPLPANAEALRARLVSEKPESIHDASGFQILMQTTLFAALALVTLLAAIGTVGAVFKMQGEGRPLMAIAYAFLSLPFFVSAWASARACRRRWRFPRQVSVCYSGLLWQFGRERPILWSEVADVTRDIREVPRYQGTGLVGAMNAINNPQPPLIIDTLRVTLVTGESYVFSPTMISEYTTFANNVGKIWSDNEKNSDFASITDAWMKARCPDIPPPAAEPAKEKPKQPPAKRSSQPPSLPSARNGRSN